MNRKIASRVLISASAFLFTACATVPAVQPVNNDQGPLLTSSTITVATPQPAANTDSGTSSSLACENGRQSATLTPQETEGPYFTANSPERSSLLEDGMSGTKILINGYVFSQNCQPIANALLDFWQADANGNYDNQGYTLRGHQYTDAGGRFELTTVIPGLYPGRTEHIHVKVQAPGGSLITTQLFFPGVSQNDSDGIYNDALLLVINETSEGMQGQFNFVVPAS